jgi:hypothetical protein
VELGYVWIDLHGLLQDRVRKLVPPLHTAGFDEGDQRRHEPLVALERAPPGHPCFLEPSRFDQHLGI